MQNILLTCWRALKSYKFGNLTTYIWLSVQSNSWIHGKCRQRFLCNVYKRFFYFLQVFTFLTFFFKFSSQRLLHLWSMHCELSPRTHTSVLNVLLPVPLKVIGNQSQSYEASPAIWNHIIPSCHPTQVNAPSLNPSQTDRYLMCLPRRDGRLSWPWWLVINRERYIQSRIQVVTTRSQPDRELAHDLLIASPMPYSHRCNKRWDEN